MSLTRIKALVLRYTFLYTRSVPRVTEVFFWPIMDLVVWGLVTQYLETGPYRVPGFIKFLIGAMIFWDILYRAQQGVTLSFLEDIWARNLLNIFVAPIRLSEFVAATYLVGLARIIVTGLVLAGLALTCYAFNLFALGWTLVPLFLNLLIMGWALGMVTAALITRWGQAAEALVWGVPFLVQPFCAAFYPLESMPRWMQAIAVFIPATHVFEGMRQVLAGHGLALSSLLAALGLNVLYLAGAAWFFRAMFGKAREKGLLAKLGTQ